MEELEPGKVTIFKTGANAIHRFAQMGLDEGKARRADIFVENRELELKLRGSDIF
jgi:hypothetical protein